MEGQLKMVWSRGLLEDLQILEELVDLPGDS